MLLGEKGIVMQLLSIQEKERGCTSLFKDQTSIYPFPHLSQPKPTWHSTFQRSTFQWAIPGKHQSSELFRLSAKSRFCIVMGSHNAITKTDNIQDLLLIQLIFLNRGGVGREETHSEYEAIHQSLSKYNSASFPTRGVLVLWWSKNQLKKKENNYCCGTTVLLCKRGRGEPPPPRRISRHSQGTAWHGCQPVMGKLRIHFP